MKKSDLSKYMAKIGAKGGKVISKDKIASNTINAQKKRGPRKKKP